MVSNVSRHDRLVLAGLELKASTEGLTKAETNAHTELVKRLNLKDNINVTNQNRYSL